MNKQELIDKAVHDLGGVFDGTLPKYNHEFDFWVTTSAEGVTTLRAVAAGFSITKEEFQQRAKELGYINGYRWGVEYPTNGKKPDLPDDVTINGEYELMPIYYSIPIEVKNAAWGSIYKFKITDQRYKPADTSYLDAPTAEPESWYCYETQKAMRLPPVGVEVIGFIGSGFKEFNCHYIGKSSIGSLVVEKPDGEFSRYHDHQINFKPLDWNRKAEAERKRVVETVYALDELSLSRGDLEFLYDKGCLRLPADKS